MRNNIYKKNRKKFNLSQSYIADNLAIPLETYKEIEEGERIMPSNLIDKFYGVINKARNNPSIEKMETAQATQDANLFFEELIAMIEKNYSNC